jgi:hypothetical protein
LRARRLMARRQTDRSVLVDLANNSTLLKVRRDTNGRDYKGVLVSCPVTVVLPGLGLPSCGLGDLNHFA